MLRLRDCAVRMEAGAKARRLGEALLRGLPVPDGLVLLPGERIDDSALLAALADLGGDRFVVRSSAAAEDLPGRSAAGLFLSLLGVPAGEVAAAAVLVRDSGASLLVRSYLGGPVPVAVLIQPLLPATCLGVLHLPPEGPVTAEERLPGEPEWAESAPRLIEEATDAALLDGARRLAALLRSTEPSVPARHGGQLVAAQIEYARLPGGAVRFLQVRPIDLTPMPDARPFVAPPESGVYLLDKGHNPDPLSAAQEGLVELVEPIGRSLGLSQCVVQGYLYYAQTPATAVVPLDLRQVKDEVLPDCDRLLRHLEGAETGEAWRPQRLRDDSQGTSARPALCAALSAYREIYRCYLGELRPVLRRARGEVEALLREHLGAGLEEHAVLLGGVDNATQRRLQALWLLGRAATPADQDTLIGVYFLDHGATSPGWDVAVCCDEEAPERVRAEAAALSAGAEPEMRRREAEARAEGALVSLQQRMSNEAAATLASRLSLARIAAALGEDDDALFFRAQRLVRRALLRRGEELVREGRLREVSRIFHVPLPLVLDSGSADLEALAEEGRAEQGRRLLLLPPERFDGGRPLWPLPPGPLLRGRGVARPGVAPVQGRARVYVSLDEAPLGAGPGEVLVLPALIPSFAPQLLRAAALVTDTGGALSHGATLALEAGVPAVVGTRSATRELRDGDEVIVDAARGLVVRLSRRSVFS